MLPALAYTIFPLGDTGLTIDFGNSIDEAINQKVLALFHSLKQDPLPNCIEVVPAYSSLTIYYDITAGMKQGGTGISAYQSMRSLLEKKLTEPLAENRAISNFLKIPVCYDPAYAPDMVEFTGAKHISGEELIEIHTGKVYTVYMLGFLPGFSYMGTVDERIAMPRRPHPRQKVEAGSIGIAGHQTGIYPLASPGGWQIIGRTPKKLFDPAIPALTLLKPGDTVQFYSISQDEFNSY